MYFMYKQFNPVFYICFQNIFWLKLNADENDCYFCYFIVSLIVFYNEMSE